MPCRRRRGAVAQADDGGVIDLTADSDGGSPPPKPKRARAAGKAPAAAAAPERRVDADGKTVRFSAAPSVKVQERIARCNPGSGHRMYLVDRRAAGSSAGDGPAEDFDVLGATGNVYTVRIARQPRCSCPDAAKGNVCKHRLWVMLRVLRVAADDPALWNRALLPAEVAAALAPRGRGARGGDGVLAPAEVRAAAAAARGGGAGPSGGAAPQGRPLDDGDECAICVEALSASADSDLTFCADCRVQMHAECIGVWLSTKAQQGTAGSCPCCRATPWRDGKNPAAPAGAGGGQYVNLGHLSHRGADTSLERLYGARAVWVRAHAGEVSMRSAVAAWEVDRGW